MKKTLLPCFLALLCLFGSELKSQVAWSPEADFPHGHYLHRGGNTHPADFPMDIFGLVDSDQGRSAGERALSPDPAPVPVFPGQREQKAGNQESDPESPDSWAACFDSSQNHPIAPTRAKEAAFPVAANHPGREEYSTPAQKGEDSPFTLRIEVNASDTAELSLQLIHDQLDSKFGYQSIKNVKLETTPGSLLEGIPRHRSATVQVPTASPFSRLKIASRNQEIVKDLWIQPGDSLALRWDNESRKLWVWGPSAPKVKIQLELLQVEEEMKIQLSPAMIISDSMAMISSADQKKRYQNTIQEYRPGWNRKISWAQTESQKIQRADQLLDLASNKHPVLTQLEAYQNRLNPALFHWLQSFWTGRLLKPALEFVRICRPQAGEWGELILNNGLQAEEYAADFSGALFPQEFVEALYLEQVILGNLSGVSFEHLSEALPDALRNQVNAFYLLREYKSLEDPDSLFKATLASSKSEAINTHLTQVYQNNLRGREFTAEPLEDRNGVEVSPETWKGKLVFLDFWLTGCGACLSFASDQFLPVVQEWKDHPDLLFVTISGDRDRNRWLKSVESGKYTSEESLNLYSGGPEHPLLKKFQIRSFPTQILLDPKGKILQTGNFPTTPEGWSDLLENYLNTGSNPSNSTPTKTPLP
ncbi:TlpA disulfide reductase family protein [Algoriphagus sp.]|uniref:TlpA family protein disulfide reductase n=1 Tax=Algoriphagus sp. TaxID=1872435 RepID=UPI0026082551|nr:TlpA disulfide reductase family protein [Algoriphagus sp.]